ncbi:MAG: ABC transporter ATP-binding protein [Deltaproteobacteria bacterium]|nr:ABC transporter ATP-binding protein [Deltaproteobacteria bacterium]
MRTRSLSHASAGDSHATSTGFLGDLRGLGRLWPYLRQDRRLIWLAAALIPIISALQSALPLILRQTIDQGVIKGDSGKLLIGSAFYLVAVATEYLARSGQTIASSLAVLRMIKIMRDKVMRHVLDLPASYHDRTLSGTLVTRATSDFDNLSESLNLGVLNSIVDVAVLIGCVIGMFLLNWHLALVALAILPLVTWVVQWFSAALKTAMTRARVKIATLNAYTQECFYGHTTLKLLGAEKTVAATYDKLNTEYRDAQMSSVILDAAMFAVLDGIASITLGLVLWLIVSGFIADSASGASASVITAGVLVAFVQYIQQLFEPLKQLGNKMAMLQGAFTSIDRVFGVLGRDERIEGNQAVSKISGDIVFSDVSFSYHKDAVQAPVLRGISFALKAGHSLALVGATGSGKSTIIKLLTKLYDGYSGAIKIGPLDLKDLEPTSLRSHMAVVPQDIALFDGTIAFNIGLERPGVERQHMIKAAQEIGAAAFIDRLPGGYDYEIREQGGNLSQGQKQLIVFARALVTSPAVIVLDEATSSIDPESETIIQEATGRLLAHRTVIVIAHRLSTVRRCDQILVMNQGQIVERGNHAQLYAAGGFYRQLAATTLAETPSEAP